MLIWINHRFHVRSLVCDLGKYCRASLGLVVCGNLVSWIAAVESFRHVHKKVKLLLVVCGLTGSHRLIISDGWFLTRSYRYDDNQPIRQDPDVGHDAHGRRSLRSSAQARAQAQ